MNIVKKTAKNILSLTIAEIVTRFLTFFIGIIIARYLGEIGYGKYSFAIAFTSFFAIISDLGLNTLTIREVARNRSFAEKYFGNILFIKFILSFFAFLSLVIVMNLMHYPSDTALVVYIIGGYVIITSYNQLFISIYRAFEIMEYETLVRVIEKVFVISLVIVLIYFEYGLLEIVLAFLLSSIFSFSFNSLVVFKKFVKPTLKVDFSFLRVTLKEALPFGITGIFVVIYFQISTIMLSFMKGDAAVGWYNAAYQLICGMMLVPTALTGAIFPLLSISYKSSQENLRKIFIISFKYLFIISLIIMIIGFVFADKIILLFYGREFENSIMALRILILIVPIIFFTYLVGTTLQSINKQKIVAFIAIANSILSIILNIILIPKFSYIGASFATLLTEGVGLSLLLYFISKYLIKIPIFEIIIKPLFSGLMLLIFIYFFMQANWIILICLSIVLYIILLYITKTFSKEDVKLFKLVFQY